MRQAQLEVHLAAIPEPELCIADFGNPAFAQASLNPVQREKVLKYCYRQSPKDLPALQLSTNEKTLLPKYHEPAKR